MARQKEPSIKLKGRLKKTGLLFEMILSPTGTKSGIAKITTISPITGNVIEEGSTTYYSAYFWLNSRERILE